MKQEEVHANARAHHGIRKIFSQAAFRKLAENFLHHFNGLANLRQQLFASAGTPAKFCISITNVGLAAENLSDKIAKVSGHMEREIACRVGDTWHGFPQRLVVRKKRYLAGEPVKLANKQCCNMVGKTDGHDAK